MAYAGSFSRYSNVQQLVKDRANNKLLCWIFHNPRDTPKTDVLKSIQSNEILNGLNRYE